MGENAPTASSRGFASGSFDREVLPMALHLRVYPEAPIDDFRPEPEIRVRLGDLLPLIAFAKRSNYLWLQDFLDDEVAVSSDFYDVLRSFTKCLRPSA